MTMEPKPRPLLGMIRAVTLTAGDLDRVEAGYRDVFGYRRIDRRPVSKAEADSWGAPAAAGRDMLIMLPESGAPTELRFIAWDMPADHRTFVTHGWNALEIIVQDPDALAERIERSDAFTLTSPPHGIDTFPYLRACQAIGPAGEYVNLTRIHPPRPDLPVAESFVDRCFIVTLGGPSIDDLLQFYAGGFGNEASEVRPVRLRMMNLNCGLDLETKHPLATIKLAERTKLELDECPDVAIPRTSDAGGLPWGVAMVSFDCGDMSAFRASALGPVRSTGGDERLAIAGPAGERIELIEATPLPS